MGNVWRKCSTCKKDINFGQVYQVCSVSSCRKHAYCSVDCWDIHNPVMNHKTSFAEEMRAPSKDVAQSQETGQRRRIIAKPSAPVGMASKEVLIVASKLKAYVKDRHGLNTSANVMDKLSDLVRNLCDDAVNNARSDGRKTLMDRDF